MLEGIGRLRLLRRSLLLGPALFIIGFFGLPGFGEKR